MDRAPFQVLIFPYRVLPNNDIVYAVFRRDNSTGGYWQGIAGGGEVGESTLESAKREAHEEAGIDPDSEYIKLDCRAMIPVVNICGFLWGEDVLVIPEYCFGVGIDHERLVLSGEHIEYRWVTYQEAQNLLRWDSNKSALWELGLVAHRNLLRWVPA